MKIEQELVKKGATTAIIFKVGQWPHYSDTTTTHSTPYYNSGVHGTVKQFIFLPPHTGMSLFHSPVLRHSIV